MYMCVYMYVCMFLMYVAMYVICLHDVCVCFLFFFVNCVTVFFCVSDICMRACVCVMYVRTYVMYVFVCYFSTDVVLTDRERNVDVCDNSE